MAGASGAIKAGSAYVSLFTENSGIDKGLDKASKRLKSWGSTLTAIGGGVFASGLALDAAFDATAFAFEHAGMEAGKLAARTGIGVEQITALGYAAERTGGSVEGLERSLFRMERTVTAAMGGSQEAVQALRNLGLTAAQLFKMSPDQQFSRIADAIARVPNATEQAARAQKIFGRGVLDILPLLKQGSAGIDEFTKRAKELHLPISADEVKTAQEFHGLMVDLKGSLQRVALEIGKAVLPGLQRTRGMILPFITDTIAWIKANSGLVFSISKAGLLLAGLGAGIFATGIAFQTVAGSLKALRLTLGFVTSPIGLITAGLAIGAVAFFKYTKAGQEAFSDLKDTALDSWDGIKAGIEAGDLGAAIDVALAGIGVAWEQTWGKMSKFFKDTWSDIKLVFSDSVLDMIARSGFLSKAFAQIGMAASDVFHAIGLESDEEHKMRQDALDFITNAGQGQRDKLADAMKANALKEHDREQQAHKDDFENDLAEAQKKLAEANQKARDARDRAKKPIGGPGEFPTGPGDFAGAIKADTAGTFAAFAAERLGGGENNAALTREATQKTAQRVKELLDFWKGA